MDKEEVLQYLISQIDILQRKAVDLQEQHDEIEKQLKSYKELLRMYRGVYESESGVGMQNILPAQILEILKKKSEEQNGISSRKSKRKKIKHRRRAK